MLHGMTIAADLASAMTTAWVVVQILIGLGLLIFIHELGHFAVAKWVGIRVETFSLGFGPRLIAFRRGETEYRLSILPLGGYVKMAGENPGEGVGDPGEFASKSIGARAAVIVAGATMNLLIAIPILWLMVMLGTPVASNEIGHVERRWPNAAREAGIEPGDRIVAVNGERAREWTDIEIPLRMIEEGEDVILRIRTPDGTEREATIVHDGSRTLGLDPYWPGRIGLVLKLLPGTDTPSPAAEAGLKEGDRILAVNDVAIDPADDRSIQSAERLLLNSPDEPVRLRILPGDDPAVEPREIEIKPAAVPGLFHGVDFDVPPHLGGIGPGSAAEAAGLQLGDEIIAIDKEPTPRWTDMSHRIRTWTGPEPLQLTVLRNGEELEIPITPEQSRYTPRIGISPDRRLRGISLDGRLRVYDMDPDAPAAIAGLRIGDDVLAVEEQGMFGEKTVPFPPIRYQDLSPRGPGAEPARTFLKVARDGRSKLVIVEPGTRGEPGFRIGWRRMETVKAESFLASIPMAFDRFGHLCGMMVDQFVILFTGKASFQELAGPVGISRIAYHSIERGFTTFLYILAVISVNLGFINLLPIPILDGGHLLFLAIEKIRGRRVPEAILAKAQMAGAIFLLGLILLVTVKDIAWPGFLE